MVNVGIIGITGRMGKAVENILENSTTKKLCGGVCSSSSESEFESVVSKSDVLIDFSNHSCITKVLEKCEKFKKPLVCGTTGLTEEEQKNMKNISKIIPIFYASNFCIGIHLLADFIEKTQKFLPNYDISILETHHKMKKDSPSGTAIFLANKVGIDKNEILARRCGKIVGEHTVTFFGEKDKLTFSHEAFDRSIFADGSVKVVDWLLKQKSGLYSMTDFINDEA